MDEIRTLFWEAMKDQWPANVEVDQPEPGNLRITYKLNDDPARPNKVAQWVSIRFVPAVIKAMSEADLAERQRIASNGANLVRWALRGYDPQVQRAEAFIIEIDTSVLDRQ